MLLEKTKLRLRLKVLLPDKQKEEAQAPETGIMAALSASDVTVLTVSPKDGLKETVYKVYCGYKIEQERFFHALNSKHVVIAEDLFDEELASS